MTAIAPPEPGRRQAIRTPMLAFLEGRHDQWQERLRISSPLLHDGFHTG